MKKDFLISLMLLLAVSIVAGISNCVEHFYCNPRIAFPLFFIVIANSSYFGSYYIQDSNSKGHKLLQIFSIPLVVLFTTFIGIALGYLFTINKHDSFIEFFQYNGSLLYILNVLLLSVCLSFITYLISSNKNVRIIFSLIISALICGILVFLFFKNASLLNDIIVSPIVIISELIIAIIGATLILFKK